MGYSSRFIPQFASVTEPIRRLIKKDTPFKFSPEQRQVFQALKLKLAEAGTLAYFDKKAPTKVIADASPVGIGAVLIQEQNGENVPICYVSRSLTECEQRYSQTEREALSLVWGCERLHPYIYGQNFDLITDHKPLELRKYVAMYRAIDNNTTEKSTVELLFNRKIRGKMPDYTMPHDAEQKGKNKLYADHRCGAKNSQLEVGDQVLMRQEKTDKLTTIFSPVPYTVVSRKGNSVTIEDSRGTQYKRNTTFVKKFVSENTNDSPVDDQTETEPTESGMDKREQLISEKLPIQSKSLNGDVAPQMRPKRQTKLPEKFKDFIVE